MTYGYIRVSTREQNEARQLDALAPYGLPREALYIDRQSGADFERPAWKRLMRRIGPGDLLIVKSIDRLGRNYDEILRVWRRLTKEKKADLLVVDLPLLDTRARGRDLTGVFIADLVLQILSYVAQAERENLRQRQAEGIAAAKARGVRFGRRRIPEPPGFAAAREAWRSGAMSSRQAAASIGMSHATFYRRCRAPEG